MGRVERQEPQHGIRHCRSGPLPWVLAPPNLRVCRVVGQQEAPGVSGGSAETLKLIVVSAVLDPIALSVIPKISERGSLPVLGTEESHLGRFVKSMPARFPSVASVHRGSSS